jgi:hypothetical protein
MEALWSLKLAACPTGFGVWRSGDRSLDQRGTVPGERFLGSDCIRQTVHPELPRAADRRACRRQVGENPHVPGIQFAQPPAARSHPERIGRQRPDSQPSVTVRLRSKQGDPGRRGTSPTTCLAHGTPVERPAPGGREGRTPFRISGAPRPCPRPVTRRPKVGRPGRPEAGRRPPDGACPESLLKSQGAEPELSRCSDRTQPSGSKRPSSRTGG